MKELFGVAALLIFAYCFWNQKWFVCAVMWSGLMVAATPTALQTANVMDRVFTIAGMLFMTGVIWFAAVVQRLDEKKGRNG